MFIAVTFLIGLVGTATLAAAAIANQIAAVTFMFPMSIAKVDNFSGAADRLNLLPSAGATFWSGSAATAATMVILLICPEFLIGSFLTGKDAMFVEVMALALPMLLLTALFQLRDGVQVIALSVLRGMNDTCIPAIVAITSFWISGVSVGALAGFSLGFSPIGVRGSCYWDSA